MNRIIPFSVIGGALALSTLAGSAGAAPGSLALSKSQVTPPTAMTEQVGWRRWHWHRRCWWRDGVRVCRRIY